MRVGNDKVGITKLSVQVVSGLQLNISPDSSIENGYVAETSVTRKLTAQYQVIPVVIKYHPTNVSVAITYTLTFIVPGETFISEF